MLPLNLLLMVLYNHLRWLFGISSTQQYAFNHQGQDVGRCLPSADPKPFGGCRRPNPPETKGQLVEKERKPKVFRTQKVKTHLCVKVGDMDRRANFKVQGMF